MSKRHKNKNRSPEVPALHAEFMGQIFDGIDSMEEFVDRLWNVLRMFQEHAANGAELVEPIDDGDVTFTLPGHMVAAPKGPKDPEFNPFCKRCEPELSKHKHLVDECDVCKREAEEKAAPPNPMTREAAEKLVWDRFNTFLETIPEKDREDDHGEEMVNSFFEHISIPDLRGICKAVEAKCEECSETDPTDCPGVLMDAIGRTIAVHVPAKAGEAPKAPPVN